jgi:4-amino-4-deoxy-L-arabinose transferase-like glycosyltransferase
LSSSRWRSPQALGLYVLAALSLIYLATVLPHLANDPIVGGDEGWIVSSAAKLAEDGVFGSELFRGFYGAEDHYYFNLPLHHFAVAASFLAFGVGIGEARLVSVLFGLAALLLTYALGRRVGGPPAAAGAAALLVLLRLNLAPFSGLTLTDLGAIARYDLPAVPYGLGAALLLLRRPESPGMAPVAVAGLLVGLAALTQFIGAFFAVPFALFLWTAALPRARRFLLAGVFIGAVLLPFLPYAVYAAADWDDFRGQARTGEQDAGGVREASDLLTPGYYWRQLIDEPGRYRLATGLGDFPDSLRDAARRPSARIALLLAAPLAAVYLLSRARGDARYRLLAFALLGLILQLALFESTKRFVYWVVVVPFLCVALADLALAVWGWRPPRRHSALARIVLVLVFGVFLGEGLAVAAQDARDAGDAASYADLGRRLEAALPNGASVIGDNRLWPALRKRNLRSLHLLFYYTNPRISRDSATDIFGAFERIDADYLLLSPLSRQILANLSPRDSADFDRYLETRTVQVQTVADSAYGPIEVYRISR